MIKVYKDLNEVPRSLRVDADCVRVNPARTTHERRLEVIRRGEYPPEDEAGCFNSRYKLGDVKSSLCLIYHNKCAFCESSQEQLDVEHFRPKRGGYYWLAFSWDNLLLSCQCCNNWKSTHFPIDGARATFDASDETLSSINTLSKHYDRVEKPLLINPETASQAELESLVFDQNGGISSSDRRMQETIDVCMLDRSALRERRQKIWDELRPDIEDAVSRSKGDPSLLKTLLEHTLESFKRKAKDPKEPYIAYRRFIIGPGRAWIKDIIISK